MKTTTPVTFMAKWFSTIAFVILFLTQALVTYRLVEQNERIKEIVVEQARRDCETRADSRSALRGIFLTLFDMFPDSVEVVQLREYMNANYPPVECPVTDE